MHVTKWLGKEFAVIVSTESLIRSRQMRVSKEIGTAWTTYEVEVITKDNRRVPLEVSTRLICRMRSLSVYRALVAT